MQAYTYRESEFDSVNRAIQANHGIVALLLPPTARDRLIDYTKATWKSLEMIQSRAASLDEDSAADYFEHQFRKLRDSFLQLLHSSPLKLFRENDEDIWQLFLKSCDFQTVQLRADSADIRKALDVEYLSQVLDRHPNYFYHLPVSSELILGPSDEGIFINIETPQRLLFLDMLLMFQHAQQSHSELEKWAQNKEEKEPFQHRARLDAYVRQVVITGASTCEAVLSDYGLLVQSIAESLNPSAKSDGFVTWPLSKKLKGFAASWSTALNLPPKNQPEVIDDMLKLIEVRNRLIHFDGRVSAWHALRIDLNWMAEQGFSRRVVPYLTPTSYGLPSTFIGYELSLAKFVLDTVLQTVDVIHCTVYRDDREALWLDIPRTLAGNVDISAAVNKERMLNLSSAMM